LLPERAFTSIIRSLRLGSGLVLFTYIGLHLINHSLGLISLATAEAALDIAIQVWSSLPGTVLLYGAFATHFVLALWAVYERRTFRLPPLELLRIALGFTLPVMLIGHAAATRLAWELYQLPSDYTHIVTNLWVTDSQGMQLGLLAPGWLHGCLGLHFAFSRRPLYQQLRFVLFAVALLLPVFSAFGFIAMARELIAAGALPTATADYLSPEHAPQWLAVAQWKYQLVMGYFAIIGAAFGARAIRNLVERSRRRLITISYPDRNVRVPRGWSVLEASRSFHLAHASMCGGRARCSTCRVRILAGEDACPPAEAAEQATLERIGAGSDVRLACQLRPEGDISVVPLVRTERPNYRPTAPRRNTEREVVVMFCDFLNHAELARSQLPQDLLYVLTLYVEALGNAIRTNGGTLSYVELDSVCALFGLERTPEQAARQALQAAAAIERATSDLNERFGRQWDCKVQVAVSIHAGRAVVGEISSLQPPAIMAVGAAMDIANELRKAAATRGKAFAVSEPVYAAVGLEPTFPDKVMIAQRGSDAKIAVSLSATAPDLPTSWRRRSEQVGRATLQRLWSGRKSA
jgi:adenylate cyclase